MYFVVLLKQIQYCLSPIFKTLLIKIEIQANLKSATSLTKCYRLKRNVLLIRNPPIQSARPFQCAYHPLTP